MDPHEERRVSKSCHTVIGAVEINGRSCGKDCDVVPLEHRYSCCRSKIEGLP
jgi:hypothetical protein